MSFPKNDDDFEDTTITSVDPLRNGYYGVGSSSGWCLGVPDVGIVPHVGDAFRTYPAGVGQRIRGIFINGREVRYATVEQDREDHRREVDAAQQQRRDDFEVTGRARCDADYLTLPAEFKRRIDGFRARNPDFRWRHEGYEMFCCMEAVKIVQGVRTTEKLDEFRALPYEKQKILVPDLDEGHSGNTFGAAVRLAHWWLANPENVVREHGALCPLVGCVEYGCEQAAKVAEVRAPEPIDAP